MPYSFQPSIKGSKILLATQSSIGACDNIIIEYQPQGIRAQLEFLAFLAKNLALHGTQGMHGMSLKQHWASLMELLWL